MCEKIEGKSEWYQVEGAGLQHGAVSAVLGRLWGLQGQRVLKVMGAGGWVGAHLHFGMGNGWVSVWAQRQGHSVNRTDASPGPA